MARDDAGVGSGDSSNTSGEIDGAPLEGAADFYNQYSGSTWQDRIKSFFSDRKKVLITIAVLILLLAVLTAIFAFVGGGKNVSKAPAGSNGRLPLAGKGEPDFKVFMARPADDTVVLSWQTDGPSDGRVDYGSNEAYGYQADDQSTLVPPLYNNSHRVLLNNLETSQTYHALATSLDANRQVFASTDLVVRPRADTTAPTVSVTNPANGATLSGTADISAEVHDPDGVYSVILFVDQRPVQQRFNNFDEDFELDTTDFANGSHIITVVASDGVNTSSSGVGVNINNDGAGDGDFDNDGQNNNRDNDDDNDGRADNSDPDDDNDGINDNQDPDDDNDGINDDQDDNDSAGGGDDDFDNDGQDNNQDPDDDNDGRNDGQDPDDDNDGINDNQDPDDDNDGTNDPVDDDNDEGDPGDDITDIYGCRVLDSSLTAAFLPYRSGDTVSGQIELATRVDARGKAIEKVWLVINNEKYAEDRQPPYEFNLDTRFYRDGVHYLKAVVLTRDGVCNNYVRDLDLELDFKNHTSNTDADSPATFNVSVSGSRNSFTVSWNTTVSSTAVVDYVGGGQQGTFRSDNLSLQHSAEVTGLRAGYTYFLELSGSTAAGVEIERYRTKVDTILGDPIVDPGPDDPVPPGECRTASDTVSVILVRPEDSQTFGNTFVTLEAKANKPIAKMYFMVDGRVIAEDSSAPYEAELDTFLYTNGEHTLRAVALTASGECTSITETGSQTSRILISNHGDPPPPPVPPRECRTVGNSVTVNLLKPSEGQVLKNETIDLEARANREIVKMFFRLGSQAIGEDSSAPYQSQLNSNQYRNGQYIVMAVALTSSGECSNVLNDGSHAARIVISNSGDDGDGDDGDGDGDDGDDGDGDDGDQECENQNDPACGPDGMRSQMTISNIAVSATDISANITFNLSEAADSVIHYGTSRNNLDQTVTIQAGTQSSSSQAQSGQNREPVGYHDRSDCSAGAVGWAYDPDDPSKPVNVQIYVDSINSSNLAAIVSANQPRSDVNASGVSGNHGFSWTLPSSYKDGNPHRIYVRVRDLTQGVVVANGSPKTVTCQGSGTGDGDDDGDDGGDGGVTAQPCTGQENNTNRPCTAPWGGIVPPGCRYVLSGETRQIVCGNGNIELPDTLFGSHSYSQCGGITQAFALDPKDLDTSPIFELYLDDNELIVALPSNQQYPYFGHFAWGLKWQMPDDLTSKLIASPGAHTIRIFAKSPKTGQKVLLSSSPASFSCNQNIAGALVSGSCSSIASGWAYDPLIKSRDVPVEIWAYRPGETVNLADANRKLATVYANQPRSDITAKPNAGFSAGPLPTGMINGRAWNIYAYALGGPGTNFKMLLKNFISAGEGNEGSGFLKDFVELRCGSFADYWQEGKFRSFRFDSLAAEDLARFRAAPDPQAAILTLISQEAGFGGSWSLSGIPGIVNDFIWAVLINIGDTNALRGGSVAQVYVNGGSLEAIAQARGKTVDQVRAELNATDPDSPYSFSGTGPRIGDYRPPQFHLVVQAFAGNPSVPTVRHSQEPGNQGPVVKFWAAKPDINTTILKGQPVTITWQVEGADSCRASGDWSGAKAIAGGSENFSPDKTSRYVLTCSNLRGSTEQTVSVTVNDPNEPVDPVNIKLFTTDTTGIDKGQSTKLRWLVDNATSCSASGGWSGNKDPKGGVEDVSPESTTTYVLTCSNQKGSANKERILRVFSVFTISASPQTVNSGEPFNISWRVDMEARGCYAEGDWSGGKDVNGGSETLTVTTSTTVTKTYTLLCFRSSDNASYRRATSVTINGSGTTTPGGGDGEGNPPGDDNNQNLLFRVLRRLVTVPKVLITKVASAADAPRVRLNASANYVKLGEKVTLSWEGTDVGGCAGPGWASGVLGASGEVEITPEETTEYEIICVYTISVSGDMVEGGEVSDSVKVTVIHPYSAFIARLQPNTTYYYKIVSTSRHNSERKAQTEVDQFLTNRPPNRNDLTASITWSAGCQGVGRVVFDRLPLNHESSVPRTVTSVVTAQGTRYNYTAILTGLHSNVTYFYRYETDCSREKSAEKSFTTPSN